MCVLRGRQASAGPGPGSRRPVLCWRHACRHNRGPLPHLMSTTHIAATPTRVSIEGATEERDARRSRRRCQDRGLRHDATALSRLTTARGHPGASPTRAYVPRPSWRNKQFMGLFLSRTPRFVCACSVRTRPRRPRRKARLAQLLQDESSEPPPCRIVQHPPSLAGLARNRGPRSSMLSPTRQPAHARRINPPSHATPR